MCVGRVVGGLCGVCVFRVCVCVRVFYFVRVSLECVHVGVCLCRQERDCSS